MQSSFIEEICEAMSQQQSPTPHPSPHRESSLGLWIGLILLLTTTILGIWAIVTKPDIIISLIAFGLVLFAIPLGIVQVIPKSLIWIQQSIRMGLLVTGIVLLLGSLVLNLIVLFGPQPRNSVGLNPSPTSGPRPTQTSILTATPSSVPVTTGHLSEFPIPTEGSHTTGITRGADGNLWFIENKGDKIGRITPQGQITEFPVSAGSDLVGLTAGPDGNLWFVGYQPNTIWRMTTSGVITGQFPIPTAGSGTETIKAGPDGNVWFVEDWGDK